MNRFWKYLALFATLCCTAHCVKDVGKIRIGLAAHDAVMLEVAVEAKEEAWFKAMNTCLRKHTLRECRGME